MSITALILVETPAGLATAVMARGLLPFHQKLIASFISFHCPTSGDGS
jgi:hypothetical protein